MPSVSNKIGDGPIKVAHSGRLTNKIKLGCCPQQTNRSIKYNPILKRDANDTTSENGKKKHSSKCIQQQNMEFITC
jgi:hypothetical protein